MSVKPEAALARGCASTTRNMLLRGITSIFAESLRVVKNSASGRYNPADVKTDEESRDVCQRLAQPIQGMAGMLRFFLAPMSCDKRIRRRIEAAIAQILYAAPGTIGAFQEKSISYKPRVKAEQPIPCVVRSALPLRTTGAVLRIAQTRIL